MHFHSLASATLMLALALPATPALGAETVSVPRFEAIELNGGGSVTVRRAPVQRVTILRGGSAYSDISVSDRRGRRSGAGDGTLVIDACRSRCPRSYRLEVLIETPDIEAVAIRGGGRIIAAQGFPRADNVAAAVSGGGEIDLRAVASRNVAAAVEGGGRLLVRIDGNLSASILGGGQILYWGDPQISTSINGGGTVSRGR